MEPNKKRIFDDFFFYPGQYGVRLNYYADWLNVAAEEALHFSLLREHMARLGFAYGDFNAHNSLWDMVEKTTDDVLARMALVPRTMEARGLDASPQMRAKLAQAGESSTTASAASSRAASTPACRTAASMVCEITNGTLSPSVAANCGAASPIR